MKIFDKISFKIYSLIILIISVVLGIVVLKFVSLTDLAESFEKFSEDYVWQSLIVLGVLIIWSLRNVIYGGKGLIERSDGILLENQNGKLLITKDSINNLIETVVGQNPNISSPSTRIEFDENNNLNVFLTFSVNIDASVKDVTADIQTKIKNAVKKATDIDIKEINIKIKNIEQLTIIQGEI